MTLTEEVLCQKAKKRELKALKKNKIIPERIVALEGLLRDVYVIRRPTQSDYHHRKNLIRVFNEIAKEIYGKSGDRPVVVEFGSFTMDIFSPKSDLDLSINFSSNSVEVPREKKIKTLRKFAKKFYGLLSKGHVSSVHPIMTANVPIIKVIDAGTGIECDLSVENRDGILKSQIVHMISSIDERFKKLSFLMKAWAKAHHINSSKDRTLNSLSIVLLVAFHLQTRDPPILPPFSVIFKDGIDRATVLKVVKQFVGYGRSNNETLAELFVTLLIKLLSVEKLWPRGLCASTYQGCWTSKTWNSKVGCISVEDFTDRSQNVAKAVAKDQVKKINSCIKLSIQYVAAFMEGELQGPRLRDFLFGRDAAVAATINISIATNSSDGKNLENKKQVCGGYHYHLPLNNHISKKRTREENEQQQEAGWGRMSAGRSWGGISSTQVWAGGPSSIMQSWTSGPSTTTAHHGWGGTSAAAANDGWGGTLQPPPAAAWMTTSGQQGWGGRKPTTGSWGGGRGTALSSSLQQPIMPLGGGGWGAQQSQQELNINNYNNWGTWHERNHNNLAPPPPYPYHHR